MSVGEIQAGKWLKEEDATWSISSNIHIPIACRQILGEWAVGEVISRPFLVDLFFAISVIVFYQFWLSLSNAFRS